VPGSRPFGSGRPIPRDEHGNFQLGGEVDGRRIDLIVDTGASFVAVPEHEAARLGYHPAARDYMWPIQTADGRGRAAKVSLELVEVAAVMVRDVDALVLPDAALTTSLLGLSFLSRLHRLEYRDGRLLLEE
jgi:aspartyl protease family protein